MPSKKEPWIPRPVKWPKEWLEQIDRARGSQSFADWLRALVVKELPDLPPPEENRGPKFKKTPRKARASDG